MPKRSVRRPRRTAIAYLRASKDEQRLSRQAQRASIEAWGYFENEHGEQAVFVYDRTRRMGTLSLGDAGWERSHPVVDGAVAGVVLGATEQAWLAACWMAATLA